MEKSSSGSWLCESRKCRFPQSHWLRNTLQELDQRADQILKIIQDDGDTFAERAEMFYKKKPELIKMVENLHQSYRSLAEKYEQLRSSETHHLINSRSSNSSKQAHHQQSAEELRNSDSLEPTHRQSESEISGKYEIVPKVIKLMEESAKHQVELARRNDEKREAIKDLHSQIEMLERENSALKRIVNCREVDDARLKRSRSRFSKLKAVFGSRRERKEGESTPRIDRGKENS